MYWMSALTAGLHGRGSGHEAENFPAVRQGQLLLPQSRARAHKGGHDLGLEPGTDEGIVANDDQTEGRGAFGQVPLHSDVAALHVTGRDGLLSGVHPVQASGGKNITMVRTMVMMMMMMMMIMMMILLLLLLHQQQQQQQQQQQPIPSKEEVVVAVEKVAVEGGRGGGGGGGGEEEEEEEEDNSYRS